MAAAWPLPGIDDTHSTSWADYGVTTGIWRLLDVLGDLPATVGVNGLVAERCPETVLAVHEAGHEIAAHSWAQDVVPALLDVEAERTNLRRCTDILGHVTGVRPTGWMSPRATGSRHTDDLLAEAGYRWTGDHGDHDLPQVLSTAHGPLVSLMHSDHSDVRDAAAGPYAYRDLHRELLNQMLAAAGHGRPDPRPPPRVRRRLGCHPRPGGRTRPDTGKNAMTHVLVVGTGAMGSHVIQHLLATTDATITVPSRHPESAHATELAALAPDRVRLVRSGPAALEVLTGQADRVFANTDFFATGSAVGEYQQGLHLLAAAERAGVERFIWSSLDSAVSLTGHPVPHFDSKAAGKETDGWYTNHVSVLTTAPYFENLRDRLAPRPDGRGGLTFQLPLGAAHYPLVALDDIAWFACHMFDDWQSWGARDLAVIGDSLTGREIAAAFAQVTGTPSTYIPMPHDELRATIPGFGHDYAAMFQFFANRDLYTRDRDINLLRRVHPELMTFKDWLHHTGWTA
ncbi:NmrA family NAD(P)-binding protein [Streptomyces sp. NPDC047049]|uniref:NmrA family NAD(P)-binding protein n=1 Tax=Streptomyces sp. NPDC047049 TaxID=3156688 RepID=UPI0033C5B6ED